MKLLSQTVVPLIVVVGLVFLVAFVTQYKPAEPVAVTTPKTGASPGVKSTAGNPTLFFPDYVIGVPIDVQLGSQATYDFWFQNKQTVPVEVGVEDKSCTCTNVQIGVVTPDGFNTPEDAKDFDRFAAVATATRILGGTHSPLESLLFDCGVAMKTYETLGKKLRWVKLLNRNSTGVQVPANGVGLVRMVWSNTEKKSDKKRLTAALWCLTPGGDAAVLPFKLELRTGLVASVIAFPQQIDMKVMKHGDKKSDRFFCWSPVHENFDLKASEIKNDPCIEIETTSLSPERCQKLEKILLERMTSDDERSATRVKSAYEVKVTVHENKGPGVHLDLGQFTRTIQMVSSVIDVPLIGRVVGEVIGGVDVHTTKGKGRIDFKSFRLDRGARHAAWITSDEPGLQFEVDRVEPDTMQKAIKVDLKPSPIKGSGTRWDMTVEVLPNQIQGAFPDHSAIILRVKGDQIRRIRVPIYGEGYTSGRAR